MSDTQQEFLDRIQEAVNRLHVKARLAEMEARDAREKLSEHYDVVRERLKHLREAADEQWVELKPQVQEAWERLKRAYESAAKSPPADG